MKEATGTDWMASMAGASSSSTREKRAESAASPAPSAAASRNPAPMRSSENPIEVHSSAVSAISTRRTTTRTGETSRICWSMAMLAPCQTSSQSATAQGRMRPRRAGFFPSLAMA